MTITASNYFAEADKFVGKLPAAAKEAHELVSSMKNDGISDPFNTGDADIDGMAQSLLDQANKILATSASSSAPVAKSAKKPTKKSRLQRKAAKSEGGRGMKKAAPKAKPAKKAKKTVRKKTVPAKAAKKHTQKAAARAVKQAVKAERSKAPVTVKKLSLELQTIKSFLGMAGKSYKAKAIIAKHTALGNHLKAGHITDHKTTIETIHRNYGKMVAAIKEHGLLTCKVNITPGTQKQYKALIADAKVRVRTEFLSGGLLNKGVSAVKKQIVKQQKKITNTTLEKTKDKVKTPKQKMILKAAQELVDDANLGGLKTKFADPGFIVRESDGAFFCPKDNQVTSTSGDWQKTLAGKCLLDWHRATKIAKLLSIKHDATFTVKEYHAKKA